MDHIDAGIIRCLTKDARMNASQISQQVNLSVSAVIERMKKLEASGMMVFVRSVYLQGMVFQKPEKMETILR